MYGSIQAIPTYRAPTLFVFTPCALETQRVTVNWLPRSSHDRSLTFNSTRHQNVSWESCPVIDSPVEHSKKPKSTLIWAFFLVFFDLHTWTQWTLNASSVSACDQSRPASPPPMLEHKFRVNKIVRIKQRGGGEPGDEAKVIPS